MKLLWYITDIFVLFCRSEIVESFQYSYLIKISSIDISTNEKSLNNDSNIDNVLYQVGNDQMRRRQMAKKRLYWSRRPWILPTVSLPNEKCPVRLLSCRHALRRLIPRRSKTKLKRGCEKTWWVVFSNWES